MSGIRKLAFTGVLFAVAIGFVALAAGIHKAGPLFGAWVPLLIVPWLLTRPGPGEQAAPTGGADASPGQGAPPDRSTGSESPN